MTLTKERIIDTIYSNTDLPKKKSTQLVETLLETIKGALEPGEDVFISGFGKFRVNKKNARRGRNPHTGEGMMLRSNSVVVFKCSSVLKDKMNGEGQKIGQKEKGWRYVKKIS
jgi:integration host factor subunit alpha